MFCYICKPETMILIYLMDIKVELMLIIGIACKHSNIIFK
jgi:hypothetical protein